MILLDSDDAIDVLSETRYGGYDMEEIKELNLSGSLVGEEFNGKISQMVNLKLLDMQDSNLGEAPDFTKLINLEKLFLSSNYLKRLTGIENCQKLREVWLDNNLFTEEEEVKIKAVLPPDCSVILIDED